MAYGVHSRRFRNRGYNSYDTPHELTANIVWDQLTNATYKVTFNFKGTEQWKIVEQIVKFIKTTIPSSQREYDQVTKTWIVGEAQIKPVIDLCNAIPNVKVNLIEKPAEQTHTARFYSRDSD